MIRHAPDRAGVRLWLDDLADDMRYGVRTLRAQPGFTAVALLTIALGLGANVAIFSVIDTVYLRPLPFDAEGGLVRVQEFSVAPDGTRRRVGAVGVTFELVRDGVRAFEGVVAQAGESFALDAGDGAQRVPAALVSEGWGSLLGVRPVMGRHFSEEEERVGEAARVALIGHGLWQRHFGARPDAVGATIRLSGRDHAVVGVMPPGFRYPYDAEVWLPARFPPDRGLYVLARLAPGATMQQANEELSAIGQRVGEVLPARAGMGVDAHPARTNMQQGEDRLAVALMGAVGFLLLIACANVAMLLTTRFVARDREIAVRAALGCGRMRQLRQLVTESLLLFVTGGALGIGLVIWLKGALTALVPRVLATQLAMGDISISGRVALFGLSLSVVAGLLFGGVAAARASTTGLQRLLREGGRSSTAAGRRRLGGLVAGEIALAVVLVTCAGLMVSAFMRLQRQDLGFEPEGLLTFRIDLPAGRYDDEAPRLDLLDRLRQRLGTLPGVVSAGATTVNPLCCGDWGARVVIEGQVPASADATPVIFHRYVTPGLLETLGVRLLEGRLFSPMDNASTEPVVIVDEHLARRFFPGGSAIGRRMKRAPYDSAHPWLTIVGVVADVTEEGEYHEGWYLPYAQGALGPSADTIHVMARTGRDPLALVGAAREAVAEIDRTVAPYDFTTMDRIRTESLRRDRMGAVLIALFASAGLLLAALGVYGVMAFVIGQQTRDIGIRLALGASALRVLRDVAGHGVRLIGIGLIVGAAGSLAAARVLVSLLEDVRGAEPSMMAVAAVVPALAAAGACMLAARRAFRVNPVDALRAE